MICNGNKQVFHLHRTLHHVSGGCRELKPHLGECAAVCKCVRQPTDLFALSVRGGVVGDFEAVEIQNVPHLVVVSSSLANNHSHVK